MSAAQQTKPVQIKPEKTVLLIIGERAPAIIPAAPSRPKDSYPKTFRNQAGVEVTVKDAKEEKTARADGYTEVLPGTLPAAQVMPPTNKPVVSRKQTAKIRHHETVVDIFKAVNIATDGSLVMLRPGTNGAFDYDDQPYDDVESDAELLVVPNRADQVGPGTALAPLPVVAPPVVPPKATPATGFSKLLRDPRGGRPDLMVHTAEEESSARADGYTQEIKPPA
jgi:hypothetical protein